MNKPFGAPPVIVNFFYITTWKIWRVVKRIERIDDMGTFKSDVEAAKQAKKDNIKVMFLPENKKWAPLCYYGIVAEKENLANAYEFISKCSWLNYCKPDILASEFKERVRKEFNIKL